MNNSIISIQKLSKSYNEVKALKSIYFNWNGGIMGLIGPNGAGKSTLIKIMSTLIKPTEGKGFIYGKDIVKESLDVRRHIGVLHENPIYNPRLKVMDSLIWVGQIRGMSKYKTEKKVLELLEKFNLVKAKNKNINKLSAGMRQKFGLIFATIGNPNLVILDEPTSNLDPDARKVYENYVMDLHEKNNINFLISSHVLGELDRICGSFIFLFNGSIVTSGKREEIDMDQGKKRFRVSTDNPQVLLSYLVKYGCIIERVLERDIFIKDIEEEKINKIPIKLKEEGVNQSITIFPLETDTEAFYNHLSEKYHQ